ncbi:hypothetical protein [Sulfurimonas sp.]|uniref:hypothetical protein n=1 Tax=Sulfurimonas sp. TaxID=2022749 RepID=UPI003D0D4B26
MKALLILLIFSVLTFASEFVIIVNPNMEIDKISKSELEKIFLSKTNTLPDGTRARPVEIAKTKLKSHFYTIIANKSEVELRSYWATLIFTGTGRPPKQMQTIKEIIEYVRTTPGAIAYIEDNKVDDAVKKLTISGL